MRSGPRRRQPPRWAGGRGHPPPGSYAGQDAYPWYGNDADDAPDYPPAHGPPAYPPGYGPSGSPAPTDWRQGYDPAWYSAYTDYGSEDYGPGGAAYGAYPYDPSDEWWEEGTGGMFSPVRVLLGLLVIVSGAATLYGMLFEEQPLQMPITVSGLAVLGLSLGLLALSSASGAASLGRRGYGGRALLAALFGGLCALGAAGALAGAVVLGMIALSA